MIVNEWDSTFTAKYGHHFPTSYLCVDTEYTGSNERDDLIVEIGHTMVEDGKIVDELNLVLNWYGRTDIQDSWLDYKLNNMRHIVGPAWRLTPKVVRKEGITPTKALKFYCKLFDAWKQRDLPFVAQNGITADERMLRGNFNRYINKPFSFPDNRYFDTGAIFKASQVWAAEEGDLTNFKLSMFPHRTDTLKVYFNRIIHTRISGLKWSLSEILSHYDLLKKHRIQDSDLHSAGFDSKCLHWIMQEYNERVSHSNIKENPFTNAKTIERAVTQQMAKYNQAQEQAAVKGIEEQKEEAPATGQTKRTKPGLSQKRRKRRQRVI